MKSESRKDIFNEKNILISGSTRGIGYATGLLFLEKGGNVVFNGRNEKQLNDVYKNLSGKYKGHVSIIQGDFTDEVQAKKMVNQFTNIADRVDVVIANVGTGKPESTNPLNVFEWRRFFDVNVVSGINLLNYVFPLMNRDGEGNVVLVSSIAAREKISAPYGYAATKSSVITLTKYLSKDWAAYGIRVNCILPGNIFFKGGRWEELRQADMVGTKRYIEENVPMKRFGKPEEVAEAIAFLASSQAAFITGVCLPVDGGQLSSV